jgi:hypothetical protein
LRAPTHEHATSQAVRVSSAAYDVLKELATEAGVPIARCLDEIIHDAYQRRVWARYAEASRRTASDPGRPTRPSGRQRKVMISIPTKGSI